MATKTISTRIKNKVDNYATWASSTNALLNGEIALVRVPTGDTYTNPVTGKTEPVVELLMKVGDGSTAFSNLPWLSAKASDVYNWAKNPAAKDVPVAVIKGSDSTATSDTLGNWLKVVYDKGITNASNISANTAAITKLNGSNTTAGSVAKAIKDAIDALDVSTSSGSGNFVTAVTQTNGKISVTKGSIAESDLPSISASKINVDSSTTLATKLGTMDAAITANTNKLAGHTDDAINTLITNKINALDGGTDSGTSGSGKYVSKVTQTNGKVATTYTSFPSASASAAGIAKLGATGGAATYDSIYGSDGKGGINKQVETNTSDIASLKSSVAGGVHFIGTVSAEPTSATVTKSDSTSHTATAGDVVLYDGREFIYTGSAWEELGDITRIGALETKIAGLDVTTGNAVATTHKFASQVKQSDGKIAVTYTRPTAADIAYGDSSDVSAKLSSIDAEIAKKMDTHEHPYAADTHTHGNITNSGTITATAVTTATGVLVYDSNNKIQRATAANARAIIGAGTSSLALGTTSTTAAAGNHTHSDYEADISALEAKVDVAKVSEAISGAINNLNFTAPSASGNATAFIDSVSQANGVITATKKTIPSASTSTAGIAKLSSSTSSTSEALAATPKAVKSAYDKGNDAQTRVAAVEGNYVRYNNDDNKLYIGKDGVDEIIFDCGGCP